MPAVRLLAAGAVALAASVALPTAVAPASAKVPAGGIHVTLVDDGSPMKGRISIYDGVDSTAVAEVEASSELPASLPAGSYLVMVTTPWGGVQCVGVAVCDVSVIATGNGEPDGSLTVTGDAVTPVTIEAAPPATLTGTGVPGSPIKLRWSAGVGRLIDVFGPSLSPSILWLSDGEPTAVVDTRTYTPGAGDVGADISARVAYVGDAATVFETFAGEAVPPRTTDSVRIEPAPTTTTATFADSTITSSQRGVVQVKVTAPKVTVTGAVTVSYDGRSVRRTLRAGAARVKLPALGPGRYRVRVTYVGTSIFTSSTAAVRTLTVTRG